MFFVKDDVLVPNNRMFVEYKDARLLAQNYNLIRNFLIHRIQVSNLEELPYTFWSTFMTTNIRSIIQYSEKTKIKNRLQMKRERKDISNGKSHKAFKCGDKTIYMLDCEISSSKFNSAAYTGYFNVVVSDEELRHHQIANFNERDIETAKIDVSKIESISKYGKIYKEGQPFYVIHYCATNPTMGATSDQFFMGTAIVDEKTFVKMKLKSQA